MNLPLPPTAWTTGTTEVFKTGSWRSALPEHVEAPSPCHLACPVSGEIAEWIALARARDFRGAWDVLTRNNPFPATAGHICHRPCESACNRREWDEPVAIRCLERTVGAMALEQGWGFTPPTQERDGHVAVIGAGPAGLAAAFHLRRRGWRVTVYERAAQPGGLMRQGIPAYRLPREVLDGEIRRLLALGIELKCGAAIASPADLQRLRDTHDAVFVAAGAGVPKRLSQLPDAPWVMQSAEYLARSNAGEPPALGHRVLVIGGGSAAMDVARSAKRAGHDVTVLALEPLDRLPAQREEVLEARAEGIRIETGAMLRTVAPAIGEGLAVRCTRVKFAPGTRRGEFHIEPIAGSDFLLAAQAIVPAIGQDPDLAPFALLPAEGALLACDARQATGGGGVWAGGDVASMARFVTEAIGMGKRAAIDIDRALRGEPRAADERGPAVAVSAIATFYHPKHARVADVQLPLDVEQALDEASRCFSCGRCTACDNCFNYCPDLAVVHRPDGGYAVLADYCKGCGLCVAECPTGSIRMQEEVR